MKTCPVLKYGLCSVHNLLSVV